jgi:hypothetical protein
MRFPKIASAGGEGQAEESLDDLLGGSDEEEGGGDAAGSEKPEPEADKTGGEG